MTDTPHFTRLEYDGVLELVFNRPEKGNAISHQMYDGLAAAVSDLANRQDLRVLLIRAVGRYFSVGTDISTMDVPDLQGSTSHFRRFYRSNARHDVFDAMEAVEKPVVVAHHASCLGGALEMSLSCDFRLASKNASYALPELNIGMIAGSGGVSRLTRAVGPSWARWLLMASEKINAERALAIGLVHEVVENDALEEYARAFALKLAGQPPEAMAMAKVSIELAKDLGKSQGRDIERLANSTLYFGAEREGMMSALAAKMKKN